MKREDLLNALDEVIYGIGSEAFGAGFEYLLFDNDYLRTFNEEASISTKIPDVGFVSAVKGQEVYKVIQKMKGEDLLFESSEKSLIITDGKTKLTMARVASDQTNSLINRYKSLEIPVKGWSDLPNDFIEGTTICLSSTSNDISKGALYGIYYHKKMMMSTDNLRVTKYRMDSSLPDKPFLIPSPACRIILRLKNFISINISDPWVHLKLGTGKGKGVVSLRLLQSNFPVDMIDALMKKQFKKDQGAFTLPEGLAEAVSRVEILSSKSTELLDFEKTIKIKRHKKGLLVMGSKEAIGSIEDLVPIKDEFLPEDFEIDVSPSFIKEAVFLSTNISISENKQLLLFSSDKLQHIMAARVNTK